MSGSFVGTVRGAFECRGSHWAWIAYGRTLIVTGPTQHFRLTVWTRDPEGEARAFVARLR